jgi:cyanophycinase
MLLAGGANCSAALRDMMEKAGGTDFVILRAVPDQGDGGYAYGLEAIGGVQTLVINSAAIAHDAAVAERVRRARALFIAGGNQHNYVRLWKGTPLAAAIEELAQRNVPIGGTSAGLAVMGEFVFPARRGVVYSHLALANPYYHAMELDRNFLTLPFLKGAITDSHFRERDRMGRLVAFLARIVQDGWAEEARGIGIDENTSLLVDGEGRATVCGPGAVYLLKTNGAPTVCRPKRPLTYRNLSVYRLSEGHAAFSLAAWTGIGGEAYTLSVEAGKLVSSPYGRIIST